MPFRRTNSPSKHTVLTCSLHFEAKGSDHTYHIADIDALFGVCEKCKGDFMTMSMNIPFAMKIA